MVSPLNRHTGHSQDHLHDRPTDHLVEDGTATPTTPLPALHSSGALLPITSEHELVRRQRTTALLSYDGAQTTRTRVPVLIPATLKRSATLPASRSQKRKYRPLVLFGSLLSSALVLSIVLLLVAPLENSQHSQGLLSTLQHLIASGPLSPFQPSSHIVEPTPTPIPALPPPAVQPPTMPVAEGYCGGTDIWGTCATAVTASGVMGTGVMEPPMAGEVITQVFGNNEFQAVCSCWRPHTGIDLATAYGTPVVASDSGQVLWTGWDWSGLGWAVKINHGHSIATIYGHLAHFIVSNGQNVTKGEVIAYEGSTGASTGPHVHFMVMVNNIWVNPTLYMALP